MSVTDSAAERAVVNIETLSEYAKKASVIFKILSAAARADGRATRAQYDLTCRSLARRVLWRPSPRFKRYRFNPFGARIVPGRGALWSSFSATWTPSARARPSSKLNSAPPRARL